MTSAARSECRPLAELRSPTSVDRRSNSGAIHGRQRRDGALRPRTADRAERALSRDRLCRQLQRTVPVPNLCPSCRRDLSAEADDVYGDALQALLAGISNVMASTCSHRCWLTRRDRPDQVPDLIGVVVAVDPSGTSGGDEWGIVVAAASAEGHGYILADLSLRGSPDACMRRAVSALHEHQADVLIGETNFGGELIEGLASNVDPTIRSAKSWPAARQGDPRRACQRPLRARPGVHGGRVLAAGGRIVHLVSGRSAQPEPPRCARLGGD